MAGHEDAGFRRKPAAKVGTPEKFRAVGGGGMENEHGLLRKSVEAGGERMGIKRRKHGIPRAGMGKLEIEPLAGREAAAAAPQGDAGMGEAAKLVPRIHY